MKHTYTTTSFIAALALAALALLLGGCSANPEKPYTLPAQASAAIDVNPDRAGVASPVSVYVYQLTEVTEFNGKDLFTLLDRPADDLGATAVERQKIQLAPESSQTLSLEVDPATRVIGAIAAFRKLDGAVWRTHLPLPKRVTKDGVLHLSLQANSIQLQMLTNQTESTEE